jgi:hypothetical protein
MAYNSYTNISTRIQEMLEDTSQETLDYIPSAIRGGELRLSKEIDTIGLKQNFDISVTTGNRTVAKPAGFRFSFDAFLYDSSSGKEKRLKHVSDDYLRDFWPYPTQTAEPRFYAQDYDNTSLMIAPTPDKTYTLRLSCAADLTPISVGNQTNYFTANCGELLYYASMVEMATFSRNDKQKMDFEEKYRNGILALNNQGRRGRRDDGMSPANPSGGQNTLKGDA